MDVTKLLRDIAPMDSYYTVGSGMSVSAIEPREGIAGEAAVLNGSHFVRVMFPSRRLHPVTACRIFPNYSAARSEAEAVARQLNVIARLGFPNVLGSIWQLNEAARWEVESFVRDWAGADGFIREVKNQVQSEV